MGFLIEPRVVIYIKLKIGIIAKIIVLRLASTSNKYKLP